jgi:hypothetical protein
MSSIPTSPTTPSTQNNDQCNPDTLLQKSTNSHTHTISPTPEARPEPPEAPETPRPDPSLNSLQVLAAYVKPLTPQQHQAIDLLLAGRSDTKTAAILNLHRCTVTRWRLYNHVFQAELNRRRQESWGIAADKIRKVLAKAVRVFKNQIAAEDQKVSFRAAKALLQLAGSSRLIAPPDTTLAPIDPSGVLELHARKLHIELATIDPKTDTLYDEDMALAVRSLMHKNASHPVTKEDAKEQPTTNN